MAKSDTRIIPNEICAHDWEESVSSQFSNEHQMEKEEQRKLFVRAAYCQGGHSIEGMKIAEQLGVDFPLQMLKLERRAIELDFDPKHLWPWMARIRAMKKIL